MYFYVYAHFLRVYEKVTLCKCVMLTTPIPHQLNIAKPLCFLGAQIYTIHKE